jgi:hypothetical protein
MENQFSVMLPSYLVLLASQLLFFVMRQMPNA